MHGLGPVADAFGRTLLQFLWEGAAIALLLAIVLVVLRSASSRPRYGAACTALGLMPLAFLATLAWELPRLSESESMLPALRADISLLTGGAGLFPPASPGAGQAWTFWVVAGWIAGASGLCVYRAAAWLWLQRLRRRGTCTPASEWQQRIAILARRVKVSRPVTLLESSLADTPITMGLLRPVILMPLGLLAGLPADQIEAILLHELAHIRRFDYLVNLLQSAVEAILFYHPAVWWVSHTVRAERELCCDDLVVATTGDAVLYAHTLSLLEHRRSLDSEPAIAATGGNLKRRIQRLLGQPAPARFSIGPLIALIVLTCAGLYGWQQSGPLEPRPPRPVQAGPATLQRPVAQARPATKAKPVTRAKPVEQLRPRVETRVGTGADDRFETGPARLDPDSPFARWLNQEVIYIISAGERAAFLDLGSDAERAYFIQQFWLLRDPALRTNENEFREEHYRRIAFANDRFAGPETPGWQTDRGRVYITYGPPDEREEHPEGRDRTGGAPSDRWRYRFLEGIGADVTIEFIDRNGDGDYRQTSDPDAGNAAYPSPAPLMVQGPGDPFLWDRVYAPVSGLPPGVQAPSYK